MRLEPQILFSSEPEREGQKMTRVFMSLQEQGLRFQDIHATHQIRRLVHLTDLYLRGTP